MATERVKGNDDDEPGDRPESLFMQPGYSPGRQPDSDLCQDWPPVTEHRFTCKLCGTVESWTTETSMKLAASWHLKDVHPEDWAALHIDPDLTPDDPARHGSRFEGWERG